MVLIVPKITLVDIRARRAFSEHGFSVRVERHVENGVGSYEWIHCRSLLRLGLLILREMRDWGGEGTRFNIYVMM